MDVSTVVDWPASAENRFGVSLAHAKDFIRAYKSVKVNGRRVCQKYPMSSVSSSVHSESFAWTNIENRVCKKILAVYNTLIRTTRYHKYLIGFAYLVVNQEKSYTYNLGAQKERSSDGIISTVTKTLVCLC